jgi:peptidyl-prolyl cis-trans isomerase C
VTDVRVNDIQVDTSAWPSEAAAAAYELLRQRAGQLGLLAAEADEDDIERALESLLEREAPGTVPSAEECRRYYEAHPEQFTRGERVSARHILFQVTPRVSVPALRARAESVLAELRRDPGRFGFFAREYSNCPSAQHGGDLGELSRGATVPEIETALFNGAYVGIYPQLVKSRFGFHILAVDRREAGRLMPFDDVVYKYISARLEEHGRRAALARYVSRLAADADVRGMDLRALGGNPEQDSATSPQGEAAR